MSLSATELLAVSTKVMRLSEKEALAYMEEHGEKMSRDKYYRILARVSAGTRKRLYEICKTRKERHLDRIDKFATIEMLMWENYHKCSDIMNKVRILKEIREMQVRISAFDNVTAGIIAQVINYVGEDHEDQTTSSSTLDGTRSQSNSIYGQTVH